MLTPKIRKEFLFSTLLLLSCNAPSQKGNPPKQVEKSGIDTIFKIPKTHKNLKEEALKQEYTSLENKFINQGFIDIQTVIPHIQIQIDYATKHNAFSQRLYDSINHIFLHPKSVRKLCIADSLLQKQNANYVFLIFDGLRPRNVQHKMWKAVKNTDKERYVASPSGSIHNYGCAVDLSVLDTTRGLLDMGTPFDSFSPLAQYRYNQRFLKTGDLSQTAIDNRIMLRKIMKAAGFHPIDTEWWHFNAFTKRETKSKFKIVE